MQEASNSRLQISFSELDKLIDLFNKLIDGVNRATKLSKEQRKQMRQSIGETCEMIDSVLTTVKQRISDVKKEVRNDDRGAKDDIYELANAEEWEHKYREFKLCLPLRNAASEIHGTILGKFVSRFSFKDPDDLRSRIEQFFRSERAAGEFVAKLLQDLSQLGDMVDQRKDFVMSELEKARRSIQVYRDKFIELENDMLTAISPAGG